MPSIRSGISGWIARYHVRTTLIDKVRHVVYVLNLGYAVGGTVTLFTEAETYSLRAAWTLAGIQVAFELLHVASLVASVARDRLANPGWRYAVVTHLRLLLFGVPALLMPTEDRRDWLQDVRESFDNRHDVELSAVAVLASHVRAFPHTLVALWADRLFGKDRVLDLEERSAPRKGDMLRRVLREWRLAIAFAIVAALLMEPIMYVITYWLHLHGLVWPWEYFLPMD